MTTADATEIIASMAVGYVTLDSTWRITQVNQAAEQILGNPASVLVGRDLWEQFPGARELEFGQVYESVMTTRTPAAFDAYYPGLGVWFELRVQPAPDGIACYFLDITARKSSDLRVAQAAERTQLVAEVAESLGASLDIHENAARLAQLVVPYLGSWSIVSVPDASGTLRDEASWHVDPDRRADVRRYADARMQAMPGTIAQEAVSRSQPIALMTDAHSIIRARLTDPYAMELFDVLAPQAATIVPMIARGRTVGVLTIYSDSDSTDHHFEVAKEIGGFAALALDNSAAYERARVARLDAEAAGRSLALLARVSEALAGTGDADEAVGRLARLVVPQLADWSLVTVLDDDRGPRSVAVAHRDPSRERELADYASLRTATMSPDAPFAVAMRTGEPVVIDEMSQHGLSAAQPDPTTAELLRALAPHGVAVLPLIARGRVLGALTLVTTHERGRHTDDEVATALEVANRAGPVLEIARSGQRARRLAESLQRSVLAVSPTIRDLQIGSRYRPAQTDNEVGGDWYDYFDLPDGSTVITMGDVMGHDVTAIAAMAQLRTFMRATAWAGRHSPAGVLSDTDSASRKLGPGVFATVITGELGQPGPDGSVVLRWSNAGHLPPALLGLDGAVRFLRTPRIDVPLGVLPGANRHDQSITLEAGSTLLFYTDGLVERRDRDIEQGLADLARVLTGQHERDVDALLDTILRQMSSDDPHGDDVALLAVRIPRADLHDAGVRLRAAARIAVTLPTDTSAPTVARSLLAAWDLSPDVAGDVALLVSELISNAIRHGLPPFTLEANHTGPELRIAVSDLGPRRPALPSHAPPPDQTSGRGLIILEALAEAWGVTESADGVGKTVWFTLRTE